MTECAHDGTVWTWGRGSAIFGEIVVKDYHLYNPAPVQVPGISDVVAVSAGGSFAVALKDDGTVWTWGTDALSPVRIDGLKDIIAMKKS